MPNITYTPDQRRAISHRDGNLLILACAGSGKTEVISRRTAELVAEGTPKSSIIVFTFTERAAKELKTRIRQHLEDLQPDDPAIGDMYVGTIHSFCLQLLKEIDAEYRQYEVMDESRQAALISRHFGEIGLGRLRGQARGNSYWRTIDTFTTTLSIVHQQDISLDEIRDDSVRYCIRNYRRIAYQHPNYFLDFDRIIAELIEVLDERPEQLAGIRERFSHLVIDEYQDINDRQEQLIELISNAGTEVQVTAVGDDDQSIYSWRGAEVENILRFGERYPDVTPVTLDYNFRSTHAIVEIANRSIRQLPDDRRTAKEMEARHWNEENEEFEETMADEGDIQLRTFEGNPGDDRQQAKERAKRREAEWVADQIEELRGTIIREKDGSERAIDYADMAILLRTNSTGDDFASVLEERSIPYVVKGAGGLFDHDEAMLIQSGFALISRSNLLVKSEDDFIENEDLEDEDDDYAELTPEETREYVRELIERLQGAGAMPTANAGRFLEWVAEKREELDEISDEEDIRRIYPQDIFHEMLDVLGAADDTDPWPQQTLFNLGRVSDLITQYEAVHQWVQPDDLQYLCMFLGGWAASNADEGSLDEALTPNAVQILTVHKAKGLEWPAVFIPRVSSRKFPHQKRYQGQDTFLSNEVFDEDQYANGDEGERRLWYVALTRAQKFLNVTSIDVPYTRPTDYHEEIAHDYVQREGEVPPRRAGDPTRPATADLLPTTYSDLECYWRCPFEYQLRSLMDFSPGVEEAYGYGQQIHNVLNEIHQRALDGEEVDEEEARQLTEERFHLRYTSGDPFEELKESAKDAIGRYLTQYPESTEFVLRTEQPFEFVDDQSGALINGTIDLLERVEQTDSGEEEREPVAVIDFKTYSWGDYEEYIKRKRSVENQLRMYAIAVRQALGFDADEARAHILSPQGPPDELVKQGVEEQIDVDVSQPSLEATMERVRESIREIEYTIQNDDATFALRGVENGHCPDCDFNTFCPGYSRFQEQLDNE